MHREIPSVTNNYPGAAMQEKEGTRTSIGRGREILMKVNLKSHKNLFNITLHLRLTFWQYVSSNLHF